MRQESKLAKLCVSLSIKDWPCFMVFVFNCHLWMSTGWKPRSGKDRYNFLGHDSSGKLAETWARCEGKQKQLGAKREHEDTCS